MLKLRAMGTTNDLKWFKKIIDRYDVFHVIRMSEPLPMKGTNKYYRMYIELDHIPQKVLDRQKKQKNKYTGQSGSRTVEGRQKGRGCDGSPVFV